MKKICNLVIDATTVKSGGGIYHLGLLLKYIDHNQDSLNINLKECIVTSKFFSYSLNLNLSKKTQDCLTLANVRNFIYPFFQFINISKRIKKYQDPSFLVLTSLNFIRSKNVIIMPQNTLPTNLIEIKKYGISIEALRLITLRNLNLYSIKKAKRIIFISKYAMEQNLNCMSKEVDRKKLISKSVVNYLPINKIDDNPKLNKNYTQICKSKLTKLLYISRVDYYKNHDYIIEELELYMENYRKNIEFLSGGYIYKPYYKRFKNLFSKKWANFKGNISYEEVLKLYKKYHFGIFASTCESCPTIVLEMMKYGLPFVICDLPLYDEIVPSVYPRFKIGKSGSLSNALNTLISNPNLINEIIIKGRSQVKLFKPEESLSTLLSTINY